MSFEAASLIIDGVSCLAIIAGFYLAWRQLVDAHEWNRRKATQDAILSYVNMGPDFEPLESEFDFIEVSEPISMEAIAKKVDNVPGLKLLLIKYLNTCEAFAIGVRQGVYDEEVLREALDGRLQAVYRAFSKFIEHRRKTYLSGNYTDFEALVNKWAHDRTNRGVRPRTGSKIGSMPGYRRKTGTVSGN